MAETESARVLWNTDKPNKNRINMPCLFESNMSNIHLKIEDQYDKSVNKFKYLGVTI